MRENGDGGMSKKASAGMGVRVENCREKKKMQEKIGRALCRCSEWSGVCVVGEEEDGEKKMGKEKKWVLACVGVGGRRKKKKMGRKDGLSTRNGRRERMERERNGSRSSLKKNGKKKKN